MKLLHTGDWHLGKRLFGADRLDEAEAALRHVAEVAESERVDAVLVSGDLLDRRLVDSAALGACLRSMERLAATAPVLAIAGNHDDPELWGHLAPYLRERGIHVAGRVLPADRAVVTLPTAAGPLHAALLPWPEPARMAVEAGASAQTARMRYADLVAALVGRYAAEATDRRRRDGGVAVLVGHLMVERAKAGGGEREMTMGITYAISAAAFPADLDYVALGHVHRPQSIPGLAAPGRYAGSAMALDFSEDNHDKSVVVVEIDADHSATRRIPITAAAPLVRLRGAIDELGALASAHPGAWFACDVELDAPEMDLVQRVRAVVPRALRVEPHYAQPLELPPDAHRERGADGAPALGELYAEWYRLNDRVLTESQSGAFAAALAEAQTETDPDD